MKNNFLTLVFLITLSGCSLFAPQPSNEIDALSERVIKEKEGVDIRIQPVDRIVAPK